MKNNILTNYYTIELPMIDQYMLSYKEEFVEKFGKNIWDRIINLNGIPFLIKYPDQGIGYIIQDHPDIISNSKVKRFNCDTHYPDIVTCLNTVKIPEQNKTVWFDIYDGSKFVTSVDLIKVNKYSWVCGILSVNEYGVVMADKLYLD